MRICLKLLFSCFRKLGINVNILPTKQKRMGFAANQALVFIFTFIRYLTLAKKQKIFSYALYHSNRKNLSGVKASIINDWLDRANSTTNESEHRHEVKN